MTLHQLYDIARLRLRSLLVRRGVERELDKELWFHFDQQVQENVGKGMSPGEARASAVRSFGGLVQIQEECRDMRRTNQLETIWNDLRYAVRALGRTPGFTVIIVLTLALAIGANSAIFSVIQGVLLRPLPYAQPDRIVRIFFNSDTYPKFPLNPYDLRDFRTRNRSFDCVAGIVRADAQLSGAGEPVMLHAFRVTAGYFRVLGFRPSIGREFGTGDETAAQGRQVILSDRVWRTRFAADPGMVGRTVLLNAQAMTVVGVMPAGVQHPGNDYHALADGDTVDLWLPFPYDGNPNSRGSHFMEGIGRLKAGVSPEQAGADLTAVLAQLASEHPAGRGWRVLLVPLYREMVGSTQRMLMVLLSAVGLLLLIACVNAANLLLSRSSARVREIAVRSALGASRGRIVRQLVTESLAIALAAGALGTVFAVGGVRVLVACLPAGFPRAAEIRLDAAVFGVTGGGGQLRLRNFLVVGETGLACVLLIAAGLMLHSFVNLLQADSGFRPQRVLTASVSVPFESYRNQAQIRHFHEQLIASLQAIPGVQAAGLGTDLPWTGYNENAGGFTVEGRPAAYNDKTTARYHAASPDYFRAMGIPLLQGRFFTGRDGKDAPNVIVVNETMAKRYWPGEDAVGKRISFNDKPQEKDWLQIAGVVGDVKDQPDSREAQPAFWWSLAQVPFRDTSVTVRSNSNPAQLASQVRLAVRGIDPGLAVADLRLMDDVASAAVASHRFTLFLVGLFAALALALATIGIYGVISYSVNQRMPEFGMRMALGARPWDLTRMILGQGLRLAVLGTAIGLVGAAGLTRLLGSLLYGVGGRDPVTFAGVALLALGTTAFACYLPARRAAGADPMRSLRAE